MFETPILYLIFNRPKETKITFEKIKEVKPQYLFITADGPRLDVKGEKEICEEVRNYVIKSIDWDCEVKTLFREENLGCGKAVSSAIDWFFDNVEMGIILEDDIIPNNSFFPYMRELLCKFKYDERVMMISGFNHMKTWGTSYSYLYAYYGGVWGWGTWKRAWNKYEFLLNNWEEVIDNKILEKVFCQPDYYIENRKRLINQVLSGAVDTWDYQWGITRFINSGLSIIPQKNLVRNIGFGLDATHTTNKDSCLNHFPSYPIEFPLKHNPFLVPEREYDYLFMKMVAGDVPAKDTKKSILKRIYGKLFI